MVTWQVAHQVANMAAAKAHAALCVGLDRCQVDVVSAIGRTDVQIMWQQMPRIFGAYLNEAGSQPGILVNNGLPRGARRYTAAHELGHHFLQHTTSVDDGSTIDIVAREEFDAIPVAGRRRAWPDQEKFAEAFAAWFLMPRRVVTNALKVLAITRPRSPLDVYRLSLLLGTSYRSTVRHLPNLKLAYPSNAAAWAKTSPAQLKAGLDRGLPAPTTRRPDVWLLEPSFAGLTLDLQAGDRLVLAGIRANQISPPPWLVEIGVATLNEGVVGVAYEASPSSIVTPGEAAVHAPYVGPWSVRLTLVETPLGLDPRTRG